MLCIQNSDQDNFIRSQTKWETWLGYTDEVSEGTWLWFNECDSTYTNWFGGEPNDLRGEDYAVTASIRGNNGWNDLRNDGWNTIYCSCQKPLLLTLSPTTKPTSELTTTPPPPPTTTTTTTTESNLLLYTSGRFSYNIYIYIYYRIHTILIFTNEIKSN